MQEVGRANDAARTGLARQASVSVLLLVWISVSIGITLVPPPEIARSQFIGFRADLGCSAHVRVPLPADRPLVIVQETAIRRSRCRIRDSDSDAVNGRQ